MSDLTMGFVFGIIVMSCLATIGFTLLELSNSFGLFLFGPIMWLCIIYCITYQAFTNIFCAKKILSYKFEELQKTGMYYGHLFGEFYLFRCYSNKNKHPILYHLIIIHRLKFI